MLGIFGGTFDPIHFGHLRPAWELREALGLEEVRMIPSALPPHRETPGAGAEHRLAMLRLGLGDAPGLVIDERELDRSGPSYTVDTLNSFRDEFGDRPLCLLLGTDAFLGLASWHRWRELPELAHIVVAHRPGWTIEKETLEPELNALFEARRVAAPAALAERSAGGVWLQPVSQLEIAATTIRELVRAGRDPRFLLPQAVADYIREQGLYREGPTQ